MNYLVHSSNATYDATDKTWYLTLEKRVAIVNEEIQIDHCTFTVTTTQSPMPDVVFLRSRALSRMIREKHTVELKTGHENATDIICVLIETHTRGRYAMRPEDKAPRSAITDQSVRKIDFYFTDGAGTVLDGEYSSSGQTNQPVNGNDAEIEAIGTDLLAWIDLDNSRVFDANYIESTGAGSDAQYIYNRGLNNLLIFVNQYGTPLTLANFGQTLALYRNGSWQSSADSTPVDYSNLAEEFSLHFMFQLNNINDFCYLFDLYMMRVIMYQGALMFYDSSGTRVNVSGVSIIPTQPYLITCVRKVNGQGYDFEWRVERLSNNQVTTATTGSGLTFPAQIARTWSMGHASTNFAQYQGPFIVHNGTDATHHAKCQAWLKNKFAGTATNTESSSEEATTSEHATWFASLSIK